MSQEIPHPEQLAPSEAFSQHFDGLATRIPELDQNRESIQQAASEIIDTFSLQPSLFEDDDHTLIFTAIADRWSKTLSGDEAEKTFLADSVALLAYNHSPQLIGVKSAMEETDGPLSHEARAAVYDKYTDRELTEKLRLAIDSGLLSEVRERLGINPDNEDPFEVRVLSIDSGNDSLGLDAPGVGEDDAYEAVQEKLQTQSDVRKWKEDLQKRRMQFRSELGTPDYKAPAWVTEVDGKRTLCLSMPLTEKILTPELTENARVYTADDRARDMAMLEHEYTHTQGGLNIDHEVNFGVNLEELRAEYFSGNKHGYLDIKNFFTDYWVATGQNVRDIFNTFPKGGNVVDIYGEIANRIGIDRMLEVVMAAPKPYIEEQSSTYMGAAHEYIGGFDGVLQRIIEDEKARGGGDAIEQRAEERAKIILGITSDHETLFHQRRNMGLNVVTDLMEQKAEKLAA